MPNDVNREKSKCSKLHMLVRDFSNFKMRCDTVFIAPHSPRERMEGDRREKPPKNWAKNHYGKIPTR